jgi:hypothetical protein
MTRAAAVESLMALGVTFGERGDVAALSRAIRDRPRRKRVFTQERQCSGKKRHISQEAARQFCKRAKRGNNPELRPYSCVYCRGWHLGNPPKR